MDRLAAEGVPFERAYCQQALCAPSRISMMTGQYPDRTGIVDLVRLPHRSQPEEMIPPRHFHERGHAIASLERIGVENS